MFEGLFRIIDYPIWIKIKVSRILMIICIALDLPRVIFGSQGEGYKNCKLPNCLGRLLSGPSGLALQLFKLIAAALRKPADHSAYTQRKCYANGCGGDFRILYELEKAPGHKPVIELANQRRCGFLGELGKSGYEAIEEKPATCKMQGPPDGKIQDGHSMEFL